MVLSQGQTTGAGAIMLCLDIPITDQRQKPLKSPELTMIPVLANMLVLSLLCAISVVQLSRRSRCVHSEDCRLTCGADTLFACVSQAGH